MGKFWSKTKHKVYGGEEFVVISSDSDWCLQFEGSQSYGICIGIDSNSRSGGQDDTAAKSAALVKEAIAGNLIPHDQVHDYSLEKERSQCTKQSLLELIKTTASKVKEKGIFILYFSGSAFLCENEGVLATANYHHVSTGITASELMEWIAPTECKARHIVIVLDCHCAKSIGEKSLSHIQGNPEKRTVKQQQVHVMCSCSTNSVLPPVKISGGSIYSYFLSSTLKQQSNQTGFDIKGSMDRIEELCNSFSKLILNYSQEDDLMSVGIQPSMDSTLNHILWKPNIDETDSCQNLKVIYDLRDNSDHDMPELHPEVITWLKSKEVQEALKTLHRNESLPTPLLYSVFSALLYSVTCLHLKHDRTHVSEKDLFVVAAIVVVLVLEESGHPNINVTRDQIKAGLHYYYKPLQSNGISAKPIDDLILRYI